MPKQQVFAIMNRKGGVGKTTTAINLAHGLSRISNPETDNILIIDLDPQGGVYQSLDLDLGTGFHTIADVLSGNVEAFDSIYNTKKEPHNLWFIPANDSLITAKVEILTNHIAQLVAFNLTSRNKPINTAMSHIFTKILSPLRHDFAFIILDCPPSLDFLADAVYDFADAAIVPVKPDYLGSIGTVQHTQNIFEAQSSGLSITIECFLPTFYRKREVLAREMLQSLQETYGATKVADPIPQTVVVEQAPALKGQTLFEYAPNSPATIGYSKLSERIWRKHYAQTTAQIQKSLSKS